MLDKLSSALKKTTDKIANAIFLDKKQVDIIIRDLQRALIEADVNIRLVLEITQEIKKSALDERIKGIEKKEHLIKILYDKLTSILGEKREILLQKKNTFMFVGLYGAGKTTTISKLASYYSKRGHSVCAIGLDVHRPAAPQQLFQACQKVNVPVFISPGEKDPKKIYKEHKKDLEKFEIVLVDTAGRDSLSEDLIKEIESLNKLIAPTETFLVMAADIGQTAKKQAEAFKSSCNLTGVIITRMDSTAKAGGALTACAEVKAPIVFIGTGEKPSDLEPFNPNSFLSRLLGMGDLESLMDKVHSVMDKKQLEKAQKSLEEGKLTLETVVQQVDSMQSLGGFSKIKDLIPGMSNLKMKDGSEELIEKQQEKTAKWKHILKSMTKDEIENPELLEKQTSRIKRIAQGAGTTTTEIRSLIKQYKMLNEMVKSQAAMSKGNLSQKDMMKLAKKFGRKMKF